MIPKKVLKIADHGRTPWISIHKDDEPLEQRKECYLIVADGSGLTFRGSVVFYINPKEHDEDDRAKELGMFQDQESAIEFCEMANEANKKRGKK